MTYTDHDVERVAEAMFLAGNPLAGPDDMDYADRAYYGGLARVALNAMEREPLENVVHDLNPGTKICHVWPLLEGGYEAEIGVPVRQDRDGWWDHERSRGEGATIDEAIRNAVSAAKGDE